MTSLGLRGLAHPVDALGQRVLRSSILRTEIITKPHDAVCGGAAAAAGNRNLRGKATTFQGAWAGGNPVFTNRDY